MLNKKLISFIVPVFNEATTLSFFHQRLMSVLKALPPASDIKTGFTFDIDFEIIYVNDGSRDESLYLLQGFRAEEPRVAILDLSRNFGKEIALQAGLDFSKGDAVVVMDADLQDPPELIPKLIYHWQQGFDVVYAKRSARLGETWLKRCSAHLFYRLINKISTIEIPKDTGDFRLLSRRACDALKQLRERHRFMKGLFSWVGFTQIAVPFEREPRVAGHSKWNYFKLWNLAIEGITSFTIAPLKIATFLGFTTAFLAFIYAIIIVYKTLCFGEPVQGYPSLMVVMLFLGGIQLITLGIIGEYLGRTFDEVKQRPLYLVKEYYEPVRCKTEYLTNVHTYG